MPKKFPIIWLTGQPGSGKTTLSNAINRLIKSEGIENSKKITTLQIDRDDLRGIMNNKNYTKEGRFKNIILAQNIALFGQNKGFLVIVSLVAPYIELREELKSKTQVCEIYLHTSEQRGRENFFSKDYVKPENNFYSIDTTEKTIEECVNEILTVYRSMATMA